MPASPATAAATRDRSIPGRPARLAVEILAVALLYATAAKLGLSLAFSAEQVSAVWPPSGLALVAVLLLGRRIAPGIALGAFVANVTANEPVGTAIGIAAGNTCEALAAVWLLERVGFERGLGRLRDVVALILSAALASTVVGATVGMLSLCAGGVKPWTAFMPLWMLWSVGDALGDVLVAPIVLSWTSAQAVMQPAERRGEALALLATAVGVSLTVFGGWLPRPLATFPLHYTLFPLVVWAALRFGQRGTATVNLVVAVLAISSTVRGSGPFATGNVDEGLVMLQLYMAAVATTGLLLGATITERDVARARAAADLERLQVQEERLRLALDAGRMGVWDWNVLTGELTWSDELEPIHGLAPGTFGGTFESFQRLVHPDDWPLVEDAIGGALREGRGYEVEFRNVRSDGTIGWVNGKGRVLRDASGRAVRMIGVGVDVTERRRLAESLQERAHELADADRRKDEFLAMLSHELRNPLAPLSTALHLLRTAPDHPQALDIAERQVKQLARLVDDLLDVSRITQGKITLQQEPVMLEDVVHRAVETVRPSLEEHRHAFTTRLPPEPIPLHADPDRLAQVLANLLGNAIKYTPPGGSISLVADRTADELTIRVRDTGAGIAPELLPHVFDLFVQEHRSLDRTRGGLGIGLTIVRRLIELHGGRVGVRSAGPGRGSEFLVHLPIEAAAGRDRGAGRGLASTPRAARGAGTRVLLVDDNVDAVESMSAVIELLGHEVRVATTGPAALAALDDGWHPHVVVSDLGLPGMDGYELARRLRARPELVDTFLVALSGYGRDEDKRLASEAGFDLYLVKPTDVDVLAELLERGPLVRGRERGSA